MKIYLQIGKDNIITDAITYPHGNYVEHELIMVPVGINGGWYKYEGGQVIEYPELRPTNKDVDVELLKQQVTDLQDALIEIVTLIS